MFVFITYVCLYYIYVFINISKDYRSTIKKGGHITNTLEPVQ